MKTLICTIQHEPDQWVFDKICAQHEVINKAKIITQKIEERFLRKSPLVLMALIRFGFHRLDYEAMSRHDRKILEVFQILPQSSSISQKDRQYEINRARKRLRWRKLRLTFFFYYFLWKMRKFDVVFIYNGSESLHRCLIEAARKLGKKTIFLEVGPFLNTITLDAQGLNYENSLPRQTAFYTNWLQNANKKQTLLKKPAIEVRDKRVQFEREDVQDINQKYIFLPLQVFRDTQMSFGGWISNMQELVELAHEVSQYLPRGWRVITKEHPRCYQRYNLEEMETDRFVFANGNATPDLIANTSLIITLNSTVGLEAMLFNKPVVTLGQAFYSFGDLTHQCGNKEDLIGIFKNPEQISFNAENRQAFIAYLINEYYLEGNMHKKTFPMTEKNRRLISRILTAE